MPSRGMEVPAAEWWGTPCHPQDGVKQQVPLGLRWQAGLRGQQAAATLPWHRAHATGTLCCTHL